jgi:hypothetical protein
MAAARYAPALTAEEVPICPNGPCGQVYVYDAEADTLELISAGPQGDPADGDFFGAVAISPDGRYVTGG